MVATYEHGSSGYNNHKCRCDTCRAGHAAAHGDYMRRRRAAARQAREEAARQKREEALNMREGWMCRPCWVGVPDGGRSEAPPCPECGETMARPRHVPFWTDEEKAAWDATGQRPMSTLAAIAKYTEKNERVNSMSRRSPT